MPDLHISLCFYKWAMSVRVGIPGEGEQLCGERSIILGICVDSGIILPDIVSGHW